ncbi:alpha/beta hydrolase [Desulfosporosinus sp. PR]|uniref:alpha/beta fold hydrolase n=1 Tax=Candidatus Desulfosporosinus nitrosoreducens TaxID=3401928 RepID=UPI0027F53CFD|nr:alpha/beta hydrolase [Desulfosporosinus sp. PR]MDQ7095187.1 alpha/beta hydrolase [Desulfosporosinus sp. PR]
MSETANRTLQVLGAKLYYKVCGSGPLLLLIHGGNGNADVYHGIVSRLAEDYTVVTYDRRGHSRSKLEDLTEAYSIETQSDDAHRLLAALTAEPAYVFGSSSGAVIGLDLTARYPGQVRTLIPHEPPLLQILPEAERVQAQKILGSLEEHYHSEGAIPAFMKFNSALGMGMNDQSQQLSAEQLAWLGLNLEYFLAREAPGIRRYILDPAILKTVTSQILPAGGRTSREFFPYHCSAALADYLGTKLVEFPGNHIGYVTAPREFAAKLREILAGQA